MVVELTETEAVDLLAVVADPVRWRLLSHLAAGEPTCVCDLQPIAGVVASLLSYHLKVLREARLVTSEKRGRWVYYTVAPYALDRLHAALPSARVITPVPPVRPRPARRACAVSPSTSAR